METKYFALYSGSVVGPRDTFEDVLILARDNWAPEQEVCVFTAPAMVTTTPAAE